MPTACVTELMCATLRAQWIPPHERARARVAGDERHVPGQRGGHAGAARAGGLARPPARCCASAAASASPGSPPGCSSGATCRTGARRRPSFFETSWDIFVYLFL